MGVTIQNKLRVLPGNQIIVPGCEPVSALTSVTLMANSTCKSSIISLAKAKEVIPTATLVWTLNPKQLWFVLPDGPPQNFGCDQKCRITDWYQILRDSSEEITTETEQSLEQACQNIYDVKLGAYS